MNKIYKLLLILTIVVFTVSCNKDDAPTVTPPHDYTVQYTEDLATIDKYLDDYYMEVTPDFEVTFTKIPAGGTQQSIRQQTTYPLQFKMVKNEDHDVDYKVYYLNFQQGVNESTTAVDSVYVSYRGKYLYHEVDEVVPSVLDKQFDYSQNPVWFPLENVVSGWQEIIPLFQTGNYTTAEGPDPVTFTGYGAGVMFLPSGLGYFNMGTSTIPAYSPLVFSFKLQKQRSRDHDRDGILSKDEVAVPTVLVPNPKPKDYDSDGDGTPNMFDTDDDGDFYYTIDETRYIHPSDPLQVVHHYPFTGETVDDPATLYVDETKGIPACGNVDFTSSGRLRKHLDPTCH